MTSSVANVEIVDLLFRRHHGWLRGWVLGRSRSVCADDVASEVFLRLLRMPYVDELREPRAMMSTIASRIISELRRRAGLWRVLEAELANDSPGLAPSAEDKLVVDEALRTIGSVLATLRPRARAAFLLSRVDGMTQQEIAKQLKVSTRTVERYLAEGMRLALTVKGDL